MRFWTIRLKWTDLAAACALLVALIASPASATLQTDPDVLYQTMKAAFDRGRHDGWHAADALYYFSTVLDAGRAYELVRPTDPGNARLEGYALDLATTLHYDPLTNRDAAEWYLRIAAHDLATDPTHGAQAQALLAKLDAEDADPQRLAHDAVADAAANLVAFPHDAEALVDNVDANLRAYLITGDVAYRSAALLAASQTEFPVAHVPADTGRTLFGLATDARNGAAGYTDTDRAAAHALLSHREAETVVPSRGHVLSHHDYLIITAPADEYFGQVKLSPLGVEDELIRIGKYLDAGWGDRMTQDELLAVEAIDDWQHQYPRDYALPRLLLESYHELARMDSPAAVQARAAVLRELTVDYNASPEARTLLPPS